MAAAPGGTASALNPRNDLLLSIGRGQLISLPGPMKDVFVADERIADVQVKSNNQLYVYGRGAGETTIYASNAAGQMVFSTNVRVGSNIDSVDQMLRVAMPNATINVLTMGNNTVLLTGTVAQPEDSAEASRLVTAYLGKESNVISRLKTATPLQVNLMVRIAEVTRSLARTLGTNLTSAVSSTSNGIHFGIANGSNQGSITTSGSTTTYTMPSNLTSSAAIALAGKVAGMDLLGSLDIGEQAGLVTTLAQPNLTALSGETAEFLAGGEYPIPMSSGLGTVSVEYKKYGVSLSYTPTVLSNGRISLRVRPEVSELSSDGAVTISGYSIPALSTRRAETTVELGSGQSFMIAGLLSNKATHTINKIPGAGDLPVLGNLFKSTSFQKGETELVIIVTPYLVKPVDDAQIRLPTDGLQTPDEVQRTLGNMITDAHSGATRAGPTAAGTQRAPAPVNAPASPAPAPAPAATGSANPGFNLN
ncbi:MAG TPA: type II and III secretion system protein family protein [Novosphingobium sp.]|nr:type II and III secretion system protein family protein [Novosphingobium sp.]